METRADAQLSGEDVRAIEALHARWVDEERAGNGAAILDLCDEDVVWLPPGGHPLLGRTAILQWTSGPAATVRDLTATNLRISGNGRVAWKTCEFVATYQHQGASRTVIRGAHLWVLSKSPEGHWHIVAASWTVL
jgi:uncharacterized protein (TIGR02246 family)